MQIITKVADDIYQVDGGAATVPKHRKIFRSVKDVRHRSYLILDDKTALVNMMDFSIDTGLLDSIKKILKNRTLDYFFLNHMNPDYYNNIKEFLDMYPNMKLVMDEKTEKIIKKYYHIDTDQRACIVNEDDCILLGTHIIEFSMAPIFR